MKPDAMHIVIETDIGRDADDVFALLFWLATKQPIDAILVSPGDHDQVAVVKSILRYCERTIPVLTPKDRKVARSTTPWHQQLVRALSTTAPAMQEEAPDGHEDALPKHPVELFVCGPVKMAQNLNIGRMTMQGGFVPYSVYEPQFVPKLDKFVGQEFVPTFNLGGTNKNVSQQLIDLPCQHLWVGKNVCHTVVYTPEVHRRFKTEPNRPEHAAFNIAIESYLADKGAKMWHDPLAATLSVYPDVGVWIDRKPVRQQGKYGVSRQLGVCSNHLSLVDLSEEPWERYFMVLR